MSSLKCQSFYSSVNVLTISLYFMFDVAVLQAVQFLTETCRDWFYMAMCTANYRRCTNTKHCGVRSSWSSKKARENYAWFVWFCGQQYRLFIRFHRHVTWQLTGRGLEPLKVRPMVNRTWDHSGYRLSQWETTLQCNDVSHWLSSYLRWYRHDTLISFDSEYIPSQKLASYTLGVQ